MEHFRKFILDFNSLTSWLAKGIILAPFLTIVYSLGPPYPNLTAVCLLTSLLQLLCLMYVFTFWNSLNQKKLQRLFKINILLFCVGLILYILLFQFFTKQAGSPTDLEVIGFVVKQEINDILASNFTIDNAFEGDSYDPTKIWEPWSVYTMRTVLLIAWLLMFNCITLTIALFSIMQKPRA